MVSVCLYYCYKKTDQFVEKMALLMGNLPPGNRTDLNASLRQAISNRVL